MADFTVIHADTLEVLRFGWCQEGDLAAQSTAPHEVVIEGRFDDAEYRFKMGPKGLAPVKRRRT
jgi:hypothetical protein